MEMVTVIYFDI